MNAKLTIDIGNSRTKLAVFTGKSIQHIEYLDKLTISHIRRTIKKFDVSYVIVASVQHLTKSMSSFIGSSENIFLLSTEMKLPFEIKYKTPKTLGLDRLSGMAGAWSLFPRQNSLVVDAGTCIKYDIIREDAKYLGGNIAPGLTMRLKAMHLLTDRLPQVEPYERYLAMGTDTKSALQVGACTGALMEVRGFIEEYKKTFDKLNILLTGGDGHFFVNNLKTKIFAAPNLVLQGLNEILDYNVQKQG
ncbi:MAG: type III pantothenate kinase [Saprospiraceae bacterium]|nr:type III pantothenate kinase [Saprospiraceae bacterium]